MSLFQKYTEQVDAFISVCHRLAQLQYVTSDGGNLAWKLEDNLLLITPTRKYKGDLLPHDLVFVDLSGKIVEGQRRPTGELPMYLKFFKARPDIQTVIHCHPPAVCAFAIRNGKNWLTRPLFPEPVIEIGPIPIVPYAEPLTEQLAQNFEPFLPRYNSFIMENHGLVTMSRFDLKMDYFSVELTEMTAHSILLALSAGEIQEISRQGVEDLSRVMQVRNLPLMGAPGVNPNLVSLYYE
jgi:L-fuculose-phosphate aldolase